MVTLGSGGLSHLPRVTQGEARPTRQCTSQPFTVILHWAALYSSGSNLKSQKCGFILQICILLLVSNE